MSFQSEIYPYRNNQHEFPRRLLEKVDLEFTEIVSIPGYSRKKLGGNRCKFRLNQGPWFKQLLGLGKAEFVCDYSAILADKIVVKALLRAWLREISDRYLDFRAVRGFEHRRFRTINDAYDTIRKNSPNGAVKFLYNELPKHNSDIVLFGGLLPPDITYNEYFSRLLAWDTLHCFGLIMELSRLNATLSNGGGSSVHYSLQAAQLWIFRNQNKNQQSIYHLVSH